MAEPLLDPALASARLRGEGLAVRYGDRVVIDGLDLAVPDGRMTVIVGPNACGKSTLLRALARLVPSASGTVTLAGRPLDGYGA